jgi:ABC-type polysaccharide/polyol phosphate transport system ATPase subunit
MTGRIKPGAMALDGVSRRFRVTHERNATLKEVLVRRRRASYTELWAVRDVSIAIAPGEAVGIVGRNGSGKSTLLKLLAGILPPHTGTVAAGGTIAAMLELGAGFHPDFTGRENVYMNAAIHGLTEQQVRERFDAIVDFAEIGEFIDMPVRTYSSGMQLRLAFGVAAHVDPDILLLDEVLAVGDEAFQRKCLNRISDFRRAGGTLIFVSHSPSAVAQVCDRAVLLSRGRVVFDGSVPDVMGRYHHELEDGSARLGSDAGTGNGDTGERGDPPSIIAAGGGWGSGAVTIRRAGLWMGERDVSFVDPGGELHLCFEVHRHAPVEPPIVGISITTPGGEAIYRDNTASHRVIIPDDRVSRVELRIPAMPLASGTFNINLTAHSPDGSMIYHARDGAVSFTVAPRAPGIGMLDLPAQWDSAPGGHG